MPRTNHRATKGGVMREIRFRAWDKKQKVMYQSDLRDFLFYSFGGFSVGEFQGYDEGHDVETDEKDSVLMQYTGLKDKNGMEIYEGDLLKYVGHDCIECGQNIKYPNHELYKVFWNQKEVAFICENEDNYMHASTWNTSMEVIGNIHQNKELLEKTNH